MTSQFEIKPIHLVLHKAGDAASPAVDAAPLRELFSRIAGPLRLHGAQGHDGVRAADLLSPIEEFTGLASSLDAQYGADARLPIADIAGAADEALRSLAELEQELVRLDLSHCCVDLYALAIGIGYWAMRHREPIGAAEIIVNALAAKANAAESRQETAATYALMQGFIAHFKPGLGADLERSNPERPWRLLNLNFAITAIRTGDDPMIRFAFTTLNDHLPDERAGFYAEAHALACQPGFPAETRSLIETEHANWTPPH